LAEPKENHSDVREPAPLTPRQCLVLPPVGHYSRAPFHEDALERLLVAGKWRAPKAGDEIPVPDGKPPQWHPLHAEKDGWFRSSDLEGGYAYVPIEAAEERIAILRAAGHSLVYVNGEPRVGDPYGHGYVHVPVALHRGVNDLLFAVGLGSFHLELVPPKAAVFFDTADVTLPDLVVGQKTESQGAVVVINATAEPLGPLEIRATLAAAEAVSTPIDAIPPLSVRKLGFTLRGPAPLEPNPFELTLELLRRSADAATSTQSAAVDVAELHLDTRRALQTHKITFRSEIDGSVQYYAITPATPTPAGEKPGIVLSLHGAGVEAIGQASCYAPKPWAHIVAPTNRRSFGFDWEDWGRLDALEVLRLAEKTLDHDPRRVYLTGHSMGGHGTWQLGALFPDRFAAIGPSAAWISMWSYARARRARDGDAMEQVFQRSVGSSDTLSLERNYRMLGIYLLHGDRDDNVPVEQARTMREHLGKFHPDFAYHEQPGAGHWWGNQCMDWKPLFDFLHERLLPKPEEVSDVDFITPSPGVSARCRWAEIDSQLETLKPSSIRIHWDAKERRFSGSSQNVAKLSVDVSHLPGGKAVRVALDGQKTVSIPWPADKRIWLERQANAWKAAAPPAPSDKRPARYGPFKQAFQNRVCLVYGTTGTPDENGWAFAKARYDAEMFWYRGNGSLDVFSDSAFLASSGGDRNVILYGNADSNAAWSMLLGDSPVQVRRGRVTVAERALGGADLACLFLRPRPGSGHALVGVVSGTGIEGMNLTYRLPYFASGIGYPDCVVFGTEVLSKTFGGVKAAGYFGRDWLPATGEFVWRK
jgi:poly(3-hydroxybutyrate) depolymerase